MGRIEIKRAVIAAMLREMANALERGDADPMHLAMQRTSDRDPDGIVSVTVTVRGRFRKQIMDTNIPTASLITKDGS